MTDLSPRARALLDASHKSLRPTHADRERIEAVLREKLGQPAQAPNTLTRRVARGSRWIVPAAGAAIGVCVLGAIAYRATVSEPHAPASASDQQPVITERAAETQSWPTQTQVAPAPAPATQISSAEQDAQGPALQQPPSAAARTSKAHARTDRLAQEVALLTQATSELRAGNANGALRTLEQHQRRFPNGTLRQERSIAKAQALCSLGRTKEGQAELEHLPRDTPSTARARESCNRR